MGNWNSGGASRPFGGGQCCGPGFDGGNGLRQMVTSVERRRSPRRAGPHQDGTPKGAGCAAHPTRSMIMPTMIDGLPDVSQYTVVEEDIPGLLPLSFQEKQGALINLGTNRLHLQRLEAVAYMHRTSGGHRTIDADCSGINLW